MNTLSPRNRASETPSPNSRPCARPLSRACGLRVAAWLALSGALFIAAPANAQGFAFSGTVDTQHQVIENGPPVAVTLPEATGGTGAVAYTCSFSHVSYSASQFNDCPAARGITFDPGTSSTPPTLIIDAITRYTRFATNGLREGNYNVTITATDSAATPQTTTLAFVVTLYKRLVVSSGATVSGVANGLNLPSAPSGGTATDGMPMAYFPGAPGVNTRFQDRYRYHLDLSGIDRSVEVQTFKADFPDVYAGYWTADDRNLYTFVINSPVAELTFTPTTRKLQGRFHQAFSGNLPYYAYDAAGATAQNNFNLTINAVAPTLAAINDVEFAETDSRSQTLPAASGTAPITYAVSIPSTAASWLNADTAPADSPRVLSITVGTAAEGNSAEVTYTATNSTGTDIRVFDVTVTGALEFSDYDSPNLTFFSGSTMPYTLPFATGGSGGPYTYGYSELPNGVGWLLDTRVASFNQTNHVDGPIRLALITGGTAAATSGDSVSINYTVTDATGSIAETFSVTVLDPLRLSASTISFDLGSTKQETLPAATGGTEVYTYSLSGQDDALWLDADVNDGSMPPTLSITTAATDGISETLTYSVSNAVGAVTTIFNVEVNALLGITADNLTFVVDDFTAQALDAATGGDGDYTYALTGDSGLTAWLTVDRSDVTVVPTLAITNTAAGGETATLVYSVTDASGMIEMATFTITVFTQVNLGGNVFLTFTTGDDTAETLAAATGGGGAPYTYGLNTVPDWLFVDSGDGTTPPTLSLNIIGANAADETDMVTLNYSAQTAVHTMTVTVNIEVIDKLALAQTALQFNINDLTQTETLSAATGGNKGPFTYTLTGAPLGDWLQHTNSSTPTAAPILQSTTSFANNGNLTYMVTDATGTALTSFAVTAIDTLGFSGGEPADLTYTVGEDNTKALPAGTGGTSPYAYLLEIPASDATWLLADTLSGATPPMLSIATGTPAAGDSDSTTITYTITDSATPTPNTFVSLIDVGVETAPAFPDAYSPVFVFTATQPSELTFLPVTGGAPPIEYTYATGDEGSDASDIVAWMSIPDPRSDGTPFVSGTPPTSQISVHTPALDEDSFNIEIMAEDFNGAEAGNAGIQAYVVVRRAPPKPDLPSELTTLGASPQLVDETTVAMTFTGLPTDSVQTVQGENAVVAAPNKSVLATPLTQELIISVINEDGSAVATFSSVSAFDAGDTSDYSVTSDDTHSQTVSAKFVHGGLTFSSLGFTTYSDTTGNYTYAPQFEVAGTFTTAGKYVFDFKATDKNGKSASSDSGTVTIGTGAGWDNDEYTFDTITLPVYELDDDGAITLPTIATTFPAAVAQADPNKMLNYGALVWVNDPDPADAIDLPLNLGIDYTPGAFTSGVAVPIAFTPNTGLFTDDANRAEMDDYIFRVEVSDDVCQACDAITLTVKVVEKSLAEAPSWDGHPGFYLVEVDSPSTLVDPATNEPYTQANGDFFIAEEGDENPDPRSIPLALTHTQDEDLKVTSANPFKGLVYSALTWIDPVAADADSNGLPAVLGIEYTAATRASTDAVPISFTVDSGNAKFQAACANANAKECPFRESYEFELSATDIDGNTAMLTFTVNLSENELPPPRSTLTPPQGNYFEINRIVMSQIGEAIVSDTINVITDRLGSVRLQQTDAEPYFGVGGESSPSKIIAKNAKGLVDGTKTPKQLLNGARLVLPLIGEYGAPLPSGMAFWISANHSDMSADTDIVNWEGDMRNIYFGVDSTVSPRAVMGMAFNRANVELDYEDLRTAPETGEEKEYAGIGKYEIDLTGINPYVSWRHGKVDLWVTLGQSVGDLTITRFEDDDPETVVDDNGVKTNLRLKTAAAGGTGLWATDGDSQLRVRGEVFTSRMEIDAAETNRGKRLDKEYDIGTVAQTIDGGLVRLGLELVNPDILPGGARMEPMYEFGARYDYGESEVGGGIEAATGLRFSGAKNQVSGIFRLHGVTSSDGAYDEWGAYALLRNRAGGDGQGLSLDLRPSYGADDSIDLWQAALETATQTALDPSQYAMQIAARIGYGITGGRGLLTPFTEWTHRDYDTYRLGVDWSPHDDFTLNLIGETEQLPSGDQQSVLLQGTINF